ncbi:hypothetical protein QOT17_004959 [Balamuthia mandrillaris]
MNLARLPPPSFNHVPPPLSNWYKRQAALMHQYKTGRISFSQCSDLSIVAFFETGLFEWLLQFLWWWGEARAEAALDAVSIHCFPLAFLLGFAAAVVRPHAPSQHFKEDPLVLQLTNPQSMLNRGRRLIGYLISLYLPSSPLGLYQRLVQHLQQKQEFLRVRGLWSSPPPTKRTVVSLFGWSFNILVPGDPSSNFSYILEPSSSSSSPPQRHGPSPAYIPSVASYVTSSLPPLAALVAFLMAGWQGLVSGHRCYLAFAPPPPSFSASSVLHRIASSTSGRGNRAKVLARFHLVTPLEADLLHAVVYHCHGSQLALEGFFIPLYHWHKCYWLALRHVVPLLRWQSLDALGVVLIIGMHIFVVVSTQWQTSRQT